MRILHLDMKDCKYCIYTIGICTELIFPNPFIHLDARRQSDKVRTCAHVRTGAVRAL